MRCRHAFAWFVAASTIPCGARAASHHGGAVGGGAESAHHEHPGASAGAPMAPGTAVALSHHGGGGGGMHAGHPGVPPGMPMAAPRHPVGLGLGAAGGGGWMFYGYPYYGTVGPTGPLYYAPPLPFFGPMFLPAIIDRGLLGGPMPVLPARPAVPVKRVKAVDPARVAQLVTFGDRLFRAGNLKRAGERYEQAIKANPDAATPRVRLAQVALSRSQFADAADLVRSAITAEPAWLAKAPDIQTIYAEPADFLRQISKLESHLLIDPNDRDAWLVLGAELYLSGQTRRASDIFVRLTDRKADPALAALLDASNAVAKEAK